MDQQEFVEHLKANKESRVRIMATNEVGTVADWDGKPSLSMLIKGQSATVGVYVHQDPEDHEPKWFALSDLDLASNQGG